MIGVVRGMATTLRHLLRPAVTEAYPDAPKLLPERSRTSFELALDEDGSHRCKACLLCANSCPNHAITIESEKRADGPGRVLLGFSIDLGLCMYCGLCVENCATQALRHTGDFETASPYREHTVLVLCAPQQPAAPVAELQGRTPSAAEARIEARHE